jgi:hypothetical protein
MPPATPPRIEPDGFRTSFSTPSGVNRAAAGTAPSGGGSAPEGGGNGPAGGGSAPDGGGTGAASGTGAAGGAGAAGGTGAAVGRSGSVGSSGPVRAEITPASGETVPACGASDSSIGTRPCRSLRCSCLACWSARRCSRRIARRSAAEGGGGGNLPSGGVGRAADVDFTIPGSHVSGRSGMGVHPGSTNQGDPRWCRTGATGTL